MDRPKLIIVRYIICIFLPLTLVASITTETQESCLKSVCGRHNGYLSIRFPFRLINTQPESCGYPGFDLFCDASNNTLLQIPSSGNFSVQAIDYKSQQIMVSDPDNCLPRQLLSGGLNDLSHSPFRYKEVDAFIDDFTFYNCSEKHENYTESMHNDKISCLSTVPNHAIVMETNSFSFGSSYESWCEVIGNNVRIPSDAITYKSSFLIMPQLLLTWDKPSCGLCEENVTRCAFKRDTSTLETTCIDFNPPIASSGLSKNARYAIGFSVGLGVPAVAVIILILYKKVIRSRRREAADHDNDGRTSNETNLQG